MLERYPIQTIGRIPKSLLQIPEPPKKLYIRGKLPDSSYIYLSIVGSRKYTTYGKEVCKKLITGLKGYKIVIVSGLALGIDSIAHEVALESKLLTVALPGSGLSEKVLYPHSHLNLAKKILDNGGCLISEYENEQEAAKWTFPRRNRIMAGISKAVLLIEAEQKSGSMITTRLATEYNRDVLTVPGSIFQSTSSGPHLLIRLGATPVRNSEEILEALGIENSNKPDQQKLFQDCSALELEIIKILDSPKTIEEVCDSLSISPQKLNSLITLLEIKGLVKIIFGKIHLFT